MAEDHPHALAVAEEVNWDSENFKMSGAVCRPFPVQRPAPPIMNAGMSRTGMEFAAENADIAFVALESFEPDKWRNQIVEFKKIASQKHNRNLQVWSNVHIIFGETDAAAHEEHVRFSRTYRDVPAVEGFINTMMKESLPADPEFAEVLRASLASGAALPLVGTPETIANELITLASYGLDGILIGFVNFFEGLPIFNSEVLPILEAADLREPFSTLSSGN